MIDVVVIGGGASGLVSAIYASRSGKRVVILEKNASCGKKLLLTGSGRCNYWNSNQNISHYHSSNIDLFDSVLNDANKKEVLDFFDSIGIIPKIKDGYYYPYSNQAVSVLSTLVKQAIINGVEIIYNTCVDDVLKVGDLFKISTNNGVYISSKVILACGSAAYPKTGSDGFGYDILSKFGHNIIKPLPALVQLRSDMSFMREWHGIRSDVSLSLIEDNECIASSSGEIQLTDYGISGICVFCLSGRVNRGLYCGRKEVISINFLYPFNINDKYEFIDFMNNRDKKVCNRSIADLLDGLINYKLVNLILKLSNINRDISWSKLDNRKREILGDNLSNFMVNITSSNSFDNAQTCCGGVSLDEINLSTMESLKVSSLYVVGEIIDVDGDCGGYNLSVAWITGMLAGKGVSYD